MRLYGAEVFFLPFLLPNFLPSNLICSPTSTNLLLLASFNFWEIHETALSRFTTLPEGESLPTARARALTHEEEERAREGGDLTSQKMRV